MPLFYMFELLQSKICMIRWFPQQRSKVKTTMTHLTITAFTRYFRQSKTRTKPQAGHGLPNAQIK